MSTTITLPDELAPALRRRVIDLVRQVETVECEYVVGQLREPDRIRCCFCHRGGKLGGHHLQDGRIAWTHKSCHRRHHRAERRPVLVTA